MPGPNCGTVTLGNAPKTPATAGAWHTRSQPRGSPHTNCFVSCTHRPTPHSTPRSRTHHTLAGIGLAPGEGGTCWAASGNRHTESVMHSRTTQHAQPVTSKHQPCAPGQESTQCSSNPTRPTAHKQHTVQPLRTRPDQWDLPKGLKAAAGYNELPLWNSRKTLAGSAAALTPRSIAPGGNR
jgi:hypothetical protein